MSNLKKILSLVLVVTMVLSLATSAMAGAFFDVKDEDDYADAINLLASLNVLLGFEDGSYQASGTYTREQFAKILYVLMNGKDDNASMYSGASPFPDVAADRWSAGYITWASNLGVINGREDGLFYPTDVVKYAEAAKMFIVAMGYSSSIYSYPYGFIDKAQTLGMFDDLIGYSTFGDANRGTVAQMAYNVLFAEAPRFGTYTTQEGNSTSTNTYTVIEGAFGVKKASGYYALDDDGKSYWDYYILEGTSTKAYGAPLYDDKQVYINNSIFDYSEDVDSMIGEPVQIWYKPPTDKDAFGTDSDLILIEKLSSVKTYTVNPMDIDTDRSDESNIYFIDGSATRRMRINAGGEYVIGWDGDYVNVAGGTGKMKYEDFKPGSNETEGSTAKKSAVYKFIDFDGDGKVDRIYADVPDFAKVTAISSTRISVSAGALVGSKTLKDDDGNTVITLYEGLAKDDRVLVYRSQAVLSGSTEDVYNVVKAESVKDVKHNSQTSSKYYFDSVQYKLVNTLGKSDLKLGDSYDIYLNANGYIAAVEKISGGASGNWILLTDHAFSTNSHGNLTAASLTGYTADGTKKTFLVDLDEVDEDVMLGTKVLLDVADDKYGSEPSDNDGKGWNQDPDPSYTNKVFGFGRVFSYTLSDAGQIDSLESLAVKASDSDDITSVIGGGKGSYDKDTNLLKLTGEGNVYLNGDSIIFNVYDGGSVAVLKLTDLPNFDINSDPAEGKNVAYVSDVANESGDATILVLNSDKKVGTSNNKFGLVISASKFAGSGSKFYYEVKLAVDGEIKTYKTKEVSDSNDNSDAIDTRLLSGDVRGYAKVTINASDEITKIDYLAYETDLSDNMADKGKAVWTHVAANSKSSSGKGLNVLGFASYQTNTVHADDNGFVIANLADPDVVDANVGDFVLDSDCAFYLLGVEPYVNFGIEANGTAKAVSNLVVSNRVSFGNGKDIDPSSVDGMSMTGSNNAWMVDLIVEDDDNDEVVVAVFIYSVPVRTSFDAN